MSDEEGRVGTRHLSRVTRYLNVETSISFWVMNSGSAGRPSRVCWMPRLIAGTISAGSVTRSPYPPNARAMSA